MIRTALIFGFSLLLTTCLFGQVKLVVAGNTADAKDAFYISLEARLATPNGPKHVLLAGDYVTECTDEMLAYDPTQGNGANVFSTVAPIVRLAQKYSEVTFYLLPGDRDWDRSGKNGLDCVKRLEDYLLAQNLDNLIWPIRNGCPGPEVIELSEQVSLLMINTQWWNHPYDKPLPADADCPTADSEIVIDETLSIIKEYRDRNLIIAGHYPPESQGRFGGEFPTRDQLKPPILGSIILSWRQNVGTPEEIDNRRLTPLRRALRNNNGLFRGLFFVGAQDQSQQLLRYRENYIINAGAAGPGRWVAKHDPAIHTSREAGFTELTFGEDGAVTYGYRLAETGNFDFQRSIYQAPCDRALNDVPVNPAYGPCGVSDEEIAILCATDPGETMVMVPGPTYGLSPLGQIFLGKHYRTAWTTPVVVPVHTTTELYGGLTPIRAGGGLQTSNLRFADDTGAEYVFRSVDKNPRKALDYDLRETFVGDILVDQTTIGHPFGPVVVPKLLDSIGILHTDPELMVLGNCPSLGDFNPMFGGTLGTLEEAPQGRKKKKGFAGTFGADEIHKSYEAFRMRYDDQEVQFAHDEFLRARLFDLLIGDWNRYEDNWEWAEFEENGIKVLRPIPRDRDNAFSLIDGIGPRMASKGFLSRLEHFGFKKPDAGSLSYQSRHLDRFLLSPLAKEDYRREAATIQSALTDELIERAVREMPNSSFAVSGEEIVAKLKVRRDKLVLFAEDLYVRYAEIVDIIGTNDEEEFTITYEQDNHVRIVVRDLKGRSEGKVLYERVFRPWETREIRIYGLGDDDVFRLDADPKGSIDIRLVGGPGKDKFYSSIRETKNKISVYEKSEVAQGEAPNGMVFRKSYRDYLYHYDRTAVEFNKIKPIFGAGFNGVNGVSVGIGFKYTKYNFTRRKYSARYKVFVETNLAGNYSVDFGAEVGDIYREVDFIANAHFGAPDIQRFFFGIGNNSLFEEEIINRNEFNAVFLQNLSGEMGLRRLFAGPSSLKLLAGIQTNETIRREGTILGGAPQYFGDGSLTYAYLRPEFILDLRDDQKLPTRGVMLEASHKQGFSLDGEGDFGVTKVAGEIHFSPRNTEASISFRAGYASSFGQIPFYELPTIGRDNGLRGYQRQRFTGDGYLFYNSEVRTPVVKIKGKFIPITLGVRAFYDRGKLLMDEDEGTGMRDSYGFGLYAIPLTKRYTLSGTMGFSREERPVIIVGFGVNFNRE